MSFSVFIPTLEIGPPYTGPMVGLRRYAYSIVHSLSNYNIEVHVVTTSKLPPNDQLLEKENVYFHYVPTKISSRGVYSTKTHMFAKNHIKFSKDAFKIFEQLHYKNPFDLIHSTELSVYAFAQAKKRDRLNIPLLMSAHGPVTTGTLKSKLFVLRRYRRLLRKTIKYCDAIISSSFSLLNKAGKLPDTLKSKVYIIPAPLNCKIYSQIPKIEDIEGFRDKYHLKQGNPTVLLLGPFIPRKLQLDVVDFFPDILAEEPKTMFLVIGNGPLLPKIKEKIVDYEIDESTVITGYVNDKELLIAYNISDLLLYPAEEGSFGTPIVEAMASGIPVITGDAPPMNEMLPPGSGWLFPLNRKDILVDIVAKILKSKEESLQFAFETKKHALKNYDYSVVGKKLIKTYKMIVKDST